MRKIATALLCVTMAATPAAAQVAPYNRTITRAAPPRFQPDYQAQAEAEARDQRVKKVLVLTGLAYLLWLATKNRTAAADDQPPISTSSPEPKEYWIERERRPAPEPAPSYVAPIGGERGLYGGSHGVGD